MIWPFKETKPPKDEELRKVVSETIRSQIKHINDLVCDIRTASKEDGGDGTKNSTG